jgi:hypothetical protein
LNQENENNDDDDNADDEDGDYFAEEDYYSYDDIIRVFISTCSFLGFLEKFLMNF